MGESNTNERRYAHKGHLLALPHLPVGLQPAPTMGPPKPTATSALGRSAVLPPSPGSAPPKKEVPYRGRGRTLSA